LSIAAICAFNLSISVSAAISSCLLLKAANLSFSRCLIASASLNICFSSSAVFLPCAFKYSISACLYSA
jgi:hypothetical protein